MIAPSFANALLFAGLGLALGLGYFAVLRRTVTLLLGGAGLSRAVPLFGLRLGLAVTAFWLIAPYGAVALLAAFGGFITARIAFQAIAGSR